MRSSHTYEYLTHIIQVQVYILPVFNCTCIHLFISNILLSISDECVSGKYGVVKWEISDVALRRESVVEWEEEAEDGADVAGNHKFHNFVPCV